MCWSYASLILAVAWLFNPHGSGTETTHPTGFWWSCNNSNFPIGYGQQCTSSGASSSHSTDHLSASTTRSLLSHSRSYSGDLCRFYRSIEGFCSSYVLAVSRLHPLSIVDCLSGAIVACHKHSQFFVHESRIQYNGYFIRILGKGYTMYPSVGFTFEESPERLIQ